MAYHISIIDDDLEIREGLKRYLELNGYVISSFASGREFLSHFSCQKIDLVILDVMMPEMDGLELCRQIRMTSQVPIIFLSAAGESFDRILGIEMGGDDYISKPFNAREILARIKSIMRRSMVHHAPKNNPIIQCPNWEIELETQKITYHSGKQEVFTHVLMQTFIYLYQFKNQIVSRDQIYKDLLKRDFEIYDRTLDIRVSRLRKLLDHNLINKETYIKTFKGSGYLLDMNDEYITTKIRFCEPIFLTLTISNYLQSSKMRQNN